MNICDILLISNQHVHPDGQVGGDGEEGWQRRGRGLWSEVDLIILIFDHLLTFDSDYLFIPIII